MISHWNNLSEELESWTLYLSEWGSGPFCLDHAFTEKVWTKLRELRFPSRLVLYASMTLPYSLHFPGVPLVCKHAMHTLWFHTSHCIVCTDKQLSLFKNFWRFLLKCTASVFVVFESVSSVNIHFLERYKKYCFITSYLVVSNQSSVEMKLQ